MDKASQPLHVRGQACSPVCRFVVVCVYKRYGSVEDVFPKDSFARSGTLFFNATLNV